MQDVILALRYVLAEGTFFESARTLLASPMVSTLLLLPQ